jgi:hypothetical protein
MKKLIRAVRSRRFIQRAEGAARRHKLTVALVIAISGTLVLTVISVSMYYVGGFYRYDLSRPGYEKERTEIARPEPQKDYDTTSPVTKTTIDTFLQEFDDRQKDLKAYGDYQDASLTDEDLQLDQ